MTNINALLKKKKNLIYLEELPESKQGAHANDTQLPDDFVSTIDGKTHFAALAASYIRQNEELIKKYTKAKNEELKPAQRRANAQDLYDKAKEIANSGLDFAEIDKTAMEFQAELASRIQELSVGSISTSPKDPQDNNDSASSYTPLSVEPKSFDMATEAMEDTVVITPNNNEQQEEPVVGAPSFELEEKTEEQKPVVEKISREALDALRLGEEDSAKEAEVDALLEAMTGKKKKQQQAAQSDDEHSM